MTPSKPKACFNAELIPTILRVVLMMASYPLITRSQPPLYATPDLGVCHTE